MINYTFNILMGLPGSGKTYYASKKAEENWNVFRKHDHIILDLDKTMPKNNNDLDVCINKELYSSTIDFNRRYGYHDRNIEVWIDGLILTKESLKTIIEQCNKFINEHCDNQFSIKFIVHVWNNDKETCINNDRLRVQNGDRDKSSEISIRNMKFDNINEDVLIEVIDSIDPYLKHSLEKHDVYKLTNYDIILKPFENNYKNDGFLVSEEWSGGGNWISYDGYEGHITADTQPEDFKEFDDLLSEVCPNITFLQYKKLKSGSVYIEDREEHDYYGGCETKFRYKCDLRKLYKNMLDLGIIPE